MTEMPTTTIRPVLKSGGNITVGEITDGSLYLRYNDGSSEGVCEPASEKLDYGGGDERQTGLVATCGMLKTAIGKIGAVSAASSEISESDIDNAFSQRRQFSCEEMREEGNVSDYVSFADYSGPVSYRTRTSDVRLFDIIYDGAPIHGEDENHNIKTEYTTAWVVPNKENLLTKQHKGDMVEIRIEYVNTEPFGGGTQEVRKCSVQRIDLGCIQPDAGSLLCRKIYDKGASETSVRIATQYGAGTTTDIQTCYSDKNHNVKYSPLSLMFPSVSKTAVFMMAFNRERLIVYRTSETVSRFRITSCRAIRSANMEDAEPGAEGAPTD